MENNILLVSFTNKKLIRKSYSYMLHKSNISHFSMKFEDCVKRNMQMAIQGIWINGLSQHLKNQLLDFYKKWTASIVS